MKKVFNLSVILAVLASALTFTSCDDDDDEATITITGTENAGEYVISAEAEIDEIAIYKESGDNESKMTSESEALTKAAKGQTTFLVNFSLFGEGTYKMSVKDKDGREEIKKNITVGGAATYNFSAKSIAVEAGKEYVYSKKAGEGAAEGSFKVTAAEKGSVTLEIGGKTVTLSDAGASWLSNDFEAWKNADVTSGADVLLCLLKESTNIAGATESSNEVISGQASATYFAAK